MRYTLAQLISMFISGIVIGICIMKLLYGI